MYFTPLAIGLSSIRAGRIRALGVTSLKRTPELPEVPTVHEAALPGYEVSPWYGLLAPAGTPRAIVERLNAEVTKIVRSPEMKGKLASQGAEPAGGTPEDYAAAIRADTATWARVVKEARLSGE